MVKITKNITNVNKTVMSGKNNKYTVIHYTGNDTDKASSNANYFKSVNRGASAHYFVDETSIYQVVEDKDAAWAVGKNYGSNNLFGIVTNRNSISIEMCSTNGKISDATFKNTVELCKYIMKKYDISPDHVYRHYDVCSKECPGWDGWLPSNESLWKKFKKQIGSTSTSTSIIETKSYPKLPFNIKVLISDLNIRETANGNKIGQYTGKGTFVIDKLSNDWGHLKNNKGWIYLGNENYVTIGKTVSGTKQVKNKKVNKNPYSEPSVNIKKGSKGEGVKWVQWELNQKNAGLEVDGIFGSKTLEAVKKYQKSNDLNVDGIVGIKTRTKMKKD